MPEDIPEELELPPDDPPPENSVGDSINPSPARKPDIGMLSLIAGGILAAFFTLLTMNHVEMNWKFSALAYAVFIVGFVWTLLSHGIPHCGRSVKTVWSLITVICFGLLGAFGVKKEYNFQNAPPQIPQTDTNLLSAVHGEGISTRDSIDGLSHVLATNQGIVPDERIAMLDIQRAQTTQQEDEIINKHEVINFDTITTKKLRQEYDFETSTQNEYLEYLKRQDDIQKQISDANSQKQRVADAAQARIDAQQAAQTQEERDQKLYLGEKFIARQILPLFERAVGELNALLKALASETGERIYTDFPGQYSSVYASSMVSNNIIVGGTNSLSMGTNSIWNFEIYSAITPEPIGYAGRFSWTFISLNIFCRSGDSNSLLTIKPLIRWRSDRIFTNLPVSSVLINLTVPNGRNIGATDSITNCDDDIYLALRRMIEEQIHQSVLTNRAPGRSARKGAASP